MYKIMTVRVPEELQRQLSDIARAKGFTRNALMLVILDDWMNSRASGAEGKSKYMVSDSDTGRR